MAWRWLRAVVGGFFVDSRELTVLVLNEEKPAVVEPAIVSRLGEHHMYPVAQSDFEDLKRRVQGFEKARVQRIMIER